MSQNYKRVFVQSARGKSSPSLFEIGSTRREKAPALTHLGNFWWFFVVWVAVETKPGRDPALAGNGAISIWMQQADI